MSPEITKNREQTMQKLIEAFDKILVEEGFQKLGINKIAKEAGVSKVLIYRYFNDFDGLFAAYLEKKIFWLDADNIDLKFLKSLKPEQMKNVATEIFIKQFESFISSVEQIELKRWEVTKYNKILSETGRKIEEPAKERNKILAKILGLKEDELAGIMALILGGIYYLGICSKNNETFNDVNLKTDKGKQIIKNAISLIIDKTI